MGEFIGAKVTEVPVEHGVRYELIRKGFRAKIDVYKDHAVWQWIHSKGDDGLGKAHELATEVLKKHGCEYLIADIADLDFFRKYGDWHEATYHGRSRARLWL